MSALRFDRSHHSFSEPGQAGPNGEGWLSVIVPAKNEAAGLSQLVAEIASALRPLQGVRPEGRCLEGFEVLVIDDGSTDATASVLEQLKGQYPELQPIRLVRNAGQSAATVAGFRAARGQWVATLDADLQNDPADLARLWDALDAEHTAALGWRARRHDSWSKRAISRCANAVRNLVLGQEIRDTGCSVRIFPRELALRLPWFQGAHRFIGPLLIREGCRILQLPVNHRARPHGKSHYNIFNRSIRVVVDLLGVAWLLRRPSRFEVVTDGVSLAVPPPMPVREAAVREARSNV
jgi:dolichol-phosphate mannosyltransferase